MCGLDGTFTFLNDENVSHTNIYSHKHTYKSNIDMPYFLLFANFCVMQLNKTKTKFIFGI